MGRWLSECFHASQACCLCRLWSGYADVLRFRRACTLATMPIRSYSVGLLGPPFFAWYGSYPEYIARPCTYNQYTSFPVSNCRMLYRAIHGRRQHPRSPWKCEKRRTRRGVKSSQRRTSRGRHVRVLSIPNPLYTTEFVLIMWFSYRIFEPRLSQRRDGGTQTRI